jgi:TonB family protein
MVPSKRIAPETVPETLPEDFNDWDGGSSSTTLPAASKEYEARQVAPPAPPRERAQAPVQTSPAPRHVENARPVEAPRHVESPRRAEAPRPAEPPRRAEAQRPVEAPRHAEKTKSGSGRNSGADSDLEAFLRRLSEVNADLAPTPRQETSQPTNLWPSPAAAQGTATARREPLPTPVKGAPSAPPKAAPVERQLFSSIGSGYEAEEEEETDGKKKPRWGLIGAISAGVVAVALAIAIPMVLRGRSVNQPRPAATPTQAYGVEESTSTPKPSPSGTTNPAPANANGQKPAPSTQQTTNSNGEPQASNTSDAANQAPVSSDSMNQQLTAASQLPQGARKPAPEEAPPPSGFGVPGMDGTGDASAIGSTFKSEIKLKLAPVNVSAGVAGGLLVRKVAPVYPSIAKTARVSGTVVLAATISKSGFVTNLQVVSGPPMLRQAAVDAVKNWAYRPYMLNNQPTEVQTTINVDFNL